MDAPSLPSRPLPDNPQYGRMFPNLPAWDPPGGAPQAKLQFLWDLSEQLYGESGDNTDIPAGYTYFGQFVNHDLTFDALSSLKGPAQPEQFRSKRTPRLDLDSVYGRGPGEQPYLYSRRDPFRFVLGQNESGELDLPRNRDASNDRYSTSGVDRERIALIGDPRNDGNTILSQLHLAFLRLHNRIYSEKKTRRGGDPRAFEEARKELCWHYQWLVMNDFLPRFCGVDLVKWLLESYGRPERRFFEFAPEPFIPIEFSLGVFRAGHSIVASSYHLSDTLEQFRGDPIAILGPSHPLQHLGGGRELPGRWSVQWDRFFDFAGPASGSAPQWSRKLDPKIAPPLRQLPLPEGVPWQQRSLAYVTLLRGWLLGMPSGQAVARQLGITSPLPRRDPRCDDPLWVYVLREAEQKRRAASEAGSLGELGRILCANVFTALLASDPESYLQQDPDWSPKLPTSGARFEVADLLEYAGAPTTAANWDARRRADGVIQGIREPVLRANG